MEEGRGSAYHRFVNTTPKPSATKKSKGLCVTLLSPVCVGDAGERGMVGEGWVMAGEVEAVVLDGMAEETT